MSLTSTMTAATGRSASVPEFQFEALGSLPCGCVAAAYRALLWDVSIVSVEAKGPHCILPGHGAGQILRVGDASEIPMTEEP